LAVSFYFDHNVNRAVTQGLRLRGVDVLAAIEDGAHRLVDRELLDRATALGRVLFSCDADLVVEARRRQRDGVAFAGVVFARQGLPVGLCVEHG
jgi:predicted nuclease of predicted toxin-antitoxin system